MFETAVEEIRQDNLAAARPISWEAASHNLRASPFKLPFLFIFIGPKSDHWLPLSLTDSLLFVRLD